MKSWDPQFDEVMEKRSLSSSTKHRDGGMERGSAAGTEDVAAAAATA